MITRADIAVLRVPMIDAAAAPLETVLLRLWTGEGLAGAGECATAPAFDGVRAEEVARALRGALALPFAEDAAAARLPRLPPGARCALDTALRDLRARRRGVPLANLLSESPARRVPVNALLTPASAAEFMDAARAARARGIRTFKIKSRGPDEDAARLSALRTAFGDGVRLRVDAGGRWTRGEALERLRALRKFAPEYVEQPLGRGDLAGMAMLAGETGVALAADEDATDADAVRAIANAGAASIVIVKLPPAGGVTGALAMLQAARECGLGAVVTSMMDTSIGVAAALHVAAAAGPLAGACGLDTGALLAGDVACDPPRITDGAMILPAGPGLGIVPDEGALSRFAAAEESAHG